MKQQHLYVPGIHAMHHVNSCCHLVSGLMIECHCLVANTASYASGLCIRCWLRGLGLLSRGLGLLSIQLMYFVK
jgi:hypothetical protein